MSKKIKAWKARLKWLEEEIPFGYFKEIRNLDGMLHADHGPAFITPTRCTCYRDGRRHGYDIDIFGSISYYYMGVLIPTRWYLKPETLTLEEIFNHNNSEVRYVGVRLYGLDRLLKSGKINIINVDADKEQILFTIEDIFIEPVCIIKVVNSTPEPDGSFKEVFLTVPPDMKSCQQAVAWTFRKMPKSYHPILET